MSGKREAPLSIEELQRSFEDLQEKLNRRLKARYISDDEDEVPDAGSQSEKGSEIDEEVEEKENDSTEANKNPEGTEPAQTGERAFAELDQETLAILGEDNSADKAKKFEFHPSLTTAWQKTLLEGLKKERKADLLDKYPRAGNCPILTPKLNPEIEAGLNDTSVKRDKFFVADQELCGAAISALGTGLSMIFNHPVEEVDTTKLLQTLVDSGRLMCDLFYHLNKARKAYLYPNLDKKAKSLLEKAETGEWLFGPDLSQRIKSAKAVEKLGLSLKSPSNEKKGIFRATSSLNWRGPSGNFRGQQQTGDRHQGHYQRNPPFYRNAGRGRTTIPARVRTTPPATQSTSSMPSTSNKK